MRGLACVWHSHRTLVRLLTTVALKSLDATKHVCRHATQKNKKVVVAPMKVSCSGGVGAEGRYCPSKCTCHITSSITLAFRLRLVQRHQEMRLYYLMLDEHWICIALNGHHASKVRCDAHRSFSSRKMYRDAAFNRHLERSYEMAPH